MEDPKAVLILSGGMDSTTLLYDLKQNTQVHTLTFYYGQRHLREIHAARATTDKLAVPHTLLHLGEVFSHFGPNPLLTPAFPQPVLAVPQGHYAEETMKQTVVPNRNMIFLSIAIGFAIAHDIPNVYYAAHSGDHAIYPDCRPEFLNALREVARIANWKPVHIHAPYLSFDKAAILRRGLRLNVDYSRTWTCYEGREKACGKCGACSERLEAFTRLGIVDPLEYETHNANNT